MLGFASMMLMGCNDFANSFANEYSSKSKTGLVFTLENESSYTVSLSDATGEIELEPGDSWTARFNKEVSIYTLNYSLSDKVKVSQSGTTFTFRNK